MKYVQSLEETLEEITEDIDRLNSKLELTAKEINPFKANAPYKDNKPALLDEISRLKEKLDDTYKRHLEELLFARELLRPQYVARKVAYLHLLEINTWRDLERMYNQSKRSLQRLKAIGIQEIYNELPKGWK